MRTLVAFSVVMVASTVAAAAFSVRSQTTSNPNHVVNKPSRHHLTSTTPSTVEELELEQDPSEEGFLVEAGNNSSTMVTLVEPEEEEAHDSQTREEDAEDKKTPERRKRSIVDFDGNSLSLKTVDSKALMPEGEPLSMRVADDGAVKKKKDEKVNKETKENDKGDDDEDEEDEKEKEEDSEEDDEDVQEKRREKRDATQDSLVQRLLEAFEPMLLSSETDPEISSKEQSLRRKRSIVDQDESSNARELDLSQPLEIDFPASDRVAAAKKVKVDLVSPHHGQHQQLKAEDQLTREDIRELASRTDLSEILSWLEALSEGRERDVASALLAAKAKWKSGNASRVGPEAEATKQEWKLSKTMANDAAGTKDIDEQHKKNRVALVDAKTEEAEGASDVATEPPRAEDDTSEKPHSEGKKQKKRRKRRRKLQSNSTQKATDESTDAH